MKSRFIVVCLVLIAMVSAVTWHFYPALPERIPVHWNAAGEVDRYGPRAMIWLLGPGLMTLVSLYGLAQPWLSPRRYGVTAFESTYLYSTGVAVVLLAYIQVLVLIVATGGQVAMARAVPAAICIVLILVGNPLGKVRKNFYLGIRTPWTLSSDRVWYATHRLGAKLMVASGMLGLVAVLADAPAWLVLLLMLWWAPVAVLYSLACYKRMEKAGTLESNGAAVSSL